MRYLEVQVKGFQQARIELGTRLRQLREGAQLNGKELAERLGWPASKVSRIENARQTATEEDLFAWGGAVGASPEILDGLTTELRNAIEEHGAWRQRWRSGLGALQEDVREMEARQKLIRAFEPSIIMGLLQTAEYARHVFAGFHDLYGGTDDVADAVRVRMQRQEILYEPTRRFQFIVHESALRHRLAPLPVMCGQIDRLLAVTSLGNVEFGIVPFEAQLPFALLHGFWIFDDNVVSVETKTQELLLRERDDIAFYVGVHARLREIARYREDARVILVRLLDEFKESDNS